MLSRAPTRLASLASLASIAFPPLLLASPPHLPARSAPLRAISLVALAPIAPHTPPHATPPPPDPSCLPHRAMATSTVAEIPATQRAATVLAYEGPKRLVDNLRLVTDKAVPSPGPNQVLVRMQLRPVNPADGLCAMGYYPGFAPANALPATLGLEGMGVVAALGEAAAQSAPDLAVGRRVVPLLALGALEAGSGAWQEYVAVDAAHVAAVPAGVSDEDAAQVAVNPLTVLGMLNQLNVPKGEYLVQSQAGSTLGRMLIQVARSRGIRTINVVRRAAQAAELKALGGDEVICSTDESVPERVRVITGGRMAHAAVESVAGDLTGAVLSSVRPGGTVLLFGGASGATFSASIGDFIFRDVTLKGFWVGPYLKSLSHEQRQAVVKEAFDLIASGTVTPFTGDKMDLSEFAAALKNQMAENRQGKILLSVRHTSLSLCLMLLSSPPPGDGGADRGRVGLGVEVLRRPHCLMLCSSALCVPFSPSLPCAFPHAALPRRHQETEELIAGAGRVGLGVEVFRQTIAGNIPMGSYSYCVFTNRGGLITRTPAAVPSHRYQALQCRASLPLRFTTLAHTLRYPSPPLPPFLPLFDPL
ncbi:unnamed protein product [Closterium sp. NIES-54]